MITLFYLENSRAVRIEWALRELNLEHETRVYARMNGQTAPPEMGRESGFSLNKSPCIQDTNGGIIVTESSAILLYLIERYGSSYNSKVRLMPELPRWQDRADVNTWMSFADGTLLFHAIPVTYVHWFLGEEKDAGVKADLISQLHPNVLKDLDYLDMELAQNLAKYDGPKNGHGAFLVGEELSAGDIMVAFSAEYILANPHFELKHRWLSIEAWLRGLEARPAFQATLKVARYDFVLPPLV